MAKSTRGRKPLKERDPYWRYRRALGYRVIENRKKEAARKACRDRAKPKGDE